MKKKVYTFLGKWEGKTNGSNYAEFTYSVYAYDYQTAIAKAADWFDGYTKKSIPFKMTFAELKLVGIKTVNE